MSEPAFIVAQDGYSVNERIERLSMSSDFPVPKIRQGNFGLYEYTFEEEPVEDSEIELFSIPHQLNRIPFALMMIAELVSDNNLYTPLSDYYLKSGADVQFEVTPPFGFFEAIIEQRISARLEANRIVVKYYGSVSVDPGYIDDGSFELELLTGRTFSFKFYIMSEGESDDDTEAVFTTT